MTLVRNGKAPEGIDHVVVVEVAVGAVGVPGVVGVVARTRPPIGGMVLISAYRIFSVNDTCAPLSSHRHNRNNFLLKSHSHSTHVIMRSLPGEP